MKYLPLLLIVSVLLGSCAICKPPRSSAETEQRVLKHDRKPFRASVPVRQWQRQRSDGYWLVWTTRGFAPTRVYAFECKPTPGQLDSLRKGFLF